MLFFAIPSVRILIILKFSSNFEFLVVRLLDVWHPIRPDERIAAIHCWCVCQWTVCIDNNSSFSWIRNPNSKQKCISHCLIYHWWNRVYWSSNWPIIEWYCCKCGLEIRVLHGYDCWPLCIDFIAEDFL